jgi:hypothetical protein
MAGIENTGFMGKMSVNTSTVCKKKCIILKYKYGWHSYQNYKDKYGKAFNCIVHTSLDPLRSNESNYCC